MQWLVVAMVAVAVWMAPAAVAAQTEDLGRAGDRIAVGANAAGTVAVAYPTAAGIRMRVSRAGWSFGPARVVAPNRRGGRATGGLRVAVGDDESIVVAWERDDRSDPEEPYARDDGCCQRIHAAAFTAGGVRSGPWRLSPGRRNGGVGPLFTGGGVVAVSWIRNFDFGQWELRVRHGGEWGHVQRPIAGSVVLPGGFGLVGGRLLAGGAGSRGDNRGVVAIAKAGTDGVFARAQAIVAVPTAPLGAVMGFDGLGGAVGFVDGYRSDGSDDYLVVQTPSGGVTRSRLGRTRGSLVTQSTGAAALLGMPFSSRFGRIRVRRPGAAFSPWRRLQVARRIPQGVDSLQLAVGRDGRAAIWALDRVSAARVDLFVTAVSASGQPAVPRRVRSFPSHPRLIGAAFDGSGRAVVVLRRRNHVQVVRA